MIDKDKAIEQAKMALKDEVEKSMNILEGHGTEQFVETLKESLSKSKVMAINFGVSIEDVNEIAEPLEKRFASFAASAKIEAPGEVLSQDEVETLLKGSDSKEDDVVNDISEDETDEATETQEEQPTMFMKIVQRILNVSWIAGVINWFQTTSLFRRVAVTALCAIIFGSLLIIFPDDVDKKEIIEVEVDRLMANSMIKPATVSVDAGEYVEFQHDKNSCLFITGNYKSGAYSPSSELVHLAFIGTDGKEYRLADSITGYRSPAEGELRFFLRITEDGNQVWSGTDKNCSTKRLSEFKKGKIPFIVKRLMIPSENAMIARMIEKDLIEGKSALIAQLKQDEEVEKIITTGRETATKIYNHLFNRSITAEKR